MLRQLHIANLAVIEDAQLELGEGLNCFTGETGAGKSLVLGAFGLLLGMRTPLKPAEMLRAGADEGRVAGVFEVRDVALAEQISALADQTIECDDELLITRRVHASGRSSTSINGQPATTGMVRAIGELLVDVHGQHDHQYLLKPANQRDILDGFGKCEAKRRAFAALFARRREVIDRLEALRETSSLRRKQGDLLRFQLEEIDTAHPQPGELLELHARHRMLSNVRRLKQEAGAASEVLNDSEGAVVERLQLLTHMLIDLAEVDERLSDTAQQLRDAALSVQDVAFDLSRYVDTLDLNPAELAEVEDRMGTLNRLLAKYQRDIEETLEAYSFEQMHPADEVTSQGGAEPSVSGDDAEHDEADLIADLLVFRDHLAASLDQLAGEDADAGTLENELAALDEQLAEAGAKLTAARKKAATKIKPQVERELKDLGMAEAQLHVAIEPADEPGPAGYDEVEFMVRTNPGQPARPLRKVASGGELSRIMLAIKGILADSDRISVLVFDEIDANIGGRLGTVIGEKLRKLAAGGHQVLCITHLPQIAAFAQQHLRISKKVSGKGKQRQTRTAVSLLDGAVRVDELAAMLAGKDVTDTTRKQVSEMLQSAK